MGNLLCAVRICLQRLTGGLLALLLFSTLSIAAPRNLQQISAHGQGVGVASVRGHFFYEPTTGKIYVRRSSQTTTDGGPRLLEVPDFALQPNLEPAQLGIVVTRGFELPHSDDQAAKPRAVVLRHGPYFSVIDPYRGQVFAANIGPIVHLGGGSGYGDFDGMVHVVFDGAEPRYLVAPVRLQRANQQRPDSPHLMIYELFNPGLNSGPAQVSGFHYVSLPEFRAGDIERGSFNVGLQIAYEVSDSSMLHLADSVDQLPANVDRASIRPILKFQATIQPAGSAHPRNGEMIVDMRVPRVTAMAWPFVGEPTLNNTGVTGTLIKNLAWRNARETIHPNMTQPGLSAEQFRRYAAVLPTESRYAGLGQQVAIAHAERRINERTRVADRVRGALQYLQGQERAIEGWVQVGLSQLSSQRHLVLVVAGPSGAGKTSSIEAYTRAMLEARGVTVPAARAGSPAAGVLTISMEGQNDPGVFVQRLEGGSPPYVGSGEPSALVSFLLNHPDGGTIVFGEADKASPKVIEGLLSLLDKGEVRLNATLVAALAKQYGSNLSRWPQNFREATNDGNNLGQITLKLDHRFAIVFDVNAGQENFGVQRAGSARRNAVLSDEAIDAANQRFTSDVVRNSLRGLGWTETVLGRVDMLMPFNMVTRSLFGAIVATNLETALRGIAENYLVDVEIAPSARAALAEAHYIPQQGARGARIASDWLARKVQALFDANDSNQRLRPGAQLVIEGRAGDGRYQAPALIVSRRRAGAVLAARTAAAAPVAVAPSGAVDDSSLHERPTLPDVQNATVALTEWPLDVHMPADPRPILRRARTDLARVLGERIVGHQSERDSVTQRIIGQLAIAAENPARSRRPGVVYFDGFSGSGKTATAEAVAIALYGSPSAMHRIDFNQVVTYADFERALADLEEFNSHHPEGGVILGDELPRAGAGSGHATLIHNMLMTVLDEGRFPSQKTPGATVRLAAGTIFIFTGNVFVTSLGQDPESMNNRAIQAYYRLAQRHPEGFAAALAHIIPNNALRDRLGAPILFAPLTLRELATIRTRALQEIGESLERRNISFNLDVSLRRQLVAETPGASGRAIQLLVRDQITNPLLTLLGRYSDTHYSGKHFELRFDARTRQVALDVYAARPLVRLNAQGDLEPAGPTVEPTIILTTVPPLRSEYHPDTRARAERKTSIHEVGHAIVTMAGLGSRAVEEMNTFGGGQGGWMEPNLSHSPRREMYSGTWMGIWQIAISLGGHLAERRYVRDHDGNPMTMDGASADYASARRTALTMLLNGSFPELTPLGLVTTSAGMQLSDEMNRQLEESVETIMTVAALLAERALEANAHLHMELVDALQRTPSMSLTREELHRLVDGRLVELTEGAMDEARSRAAQRLARRLASSGGRAYNSCNAWLTGVPDVTELPGVLNQSAPAANTLSAAPTADANPTFMRRAGRFVGRVMNRLRGGR